LRRLGDLDPSTYTALKGLGDFNPPLPPGADAEGSDAAGRSHAGRNLHFGVDAELGPLDAQPQSYRDGVLPPAVPARLAVEPGVAQGWHRYAGERGDVLGIDRFGASAPAKVEQYGSRSPTSWRGRNGSRRPELSPHEIGDGAARGTRRHPGTSTHALTDRYQ